MKALKLLWIVPLVIVIWFISTVMIDPKHCSIDYYYKVGGISDKWLDRYTKEELEGVVWIAEGYWERELGREIFYHDEESKNTIDFLDNIECGDGGASGCAHFNEYDNGTMANNFRIELDSEDILYHDVEGCIGYEDNLTLWITVHELGHIIGLDHIDEKYSVMSQQPICGKPDLSDKDKKALNEFCNE